MLVKNTEAGEDADSSVGLMVAVVVVVCLVVVLAVIFLRTRRQRPAGRKAAAARIAESADQPGYLAPMVCNPAYVVPDVLEGDYLAPVTSNPGYAVASTIKAGQGGHVYEYAEADADTPEGLYAEAQVDAAEPAEYMAGCTPVYAEPSPLTAYVQDARIGGIYATAANTDYAVPVALVERKPKQGFTRTPSVYNGFGDDFSFD